MRLRREQRRTWINSHNDRKHIDFNWCNGKLLHEESPLTGHSILCNIKWLPECGRRQIFCCRHHCYVTKLRKGSFSFKPVYALVNVNV